MGHPGRLSIGLAATATVILLILIGVAAYTMPARFDSSAAPKPLASGTIQPAPVKAAPAAAVVKAAAAPAAGSLISATFSQLPQAQAATAGAAVSAAADAAPLMPAAPTTHVVKTTTIRVDPAADAATAQQPVALAMANPAADPAAGGQAPPATAATGAAAAATPTAVAAPAPDATSLASVSTDTAPVPMGPPSKAAKTKAAADKSTPAPAGGQMKVGGSGVSVRSGPSKSKSVLFNLAAGQKVTVGARQRGWVQITDAQGRSGWAYSDFLRKS